jgi:Fe-S cluster assembly protein SufD
VIHQEGPSGWSLSSARATLQTQAKLIMNTMSMGGQTVRNSIRTLLQGEGAECHLNGLDVLKDSTEVYHHTVMEHWVPNCVSDQYYKGILDNTAKSEFNGLVFVAKGADGTDSQQLNKNLMLSEEARVWTRPQLQINADDVKCAHGATVGQLEEDQLFYFASRGLDRELAQALLTFGFAEEMILRITSPLIQKALTARVLQMLYARDAGLMRQLATSKKD